MIKPNESKYLKRSATLYKINGALFLLIILLAVTVSSWLKDYSEILELLIGLTTFTLFILTPVGLFYSWKSYQRKEGLLKTRLKYLVGNFFFCMLVLLTLAQLIRDISTLFN